MQLNTEPFVGPRPFEQADRDFFFGRSQETDELVSLITAHPVVLLYAQSGAGKTSLVQAGLVNLLSDEEKFCVVPAMRVRENVAASLKPETVDNVFMFNALASISAPEAVAGLANLSLSDFLKRRSNGRAGNGHCSPTIIIFDQFEELFTLYPERWEDRIDFFSQVRDALAIDPLLRVLFSMREDFIAELDPYVCLLPEKLRTRFRMERLRENTALGAVMEPLLKVDTPAGKRRFAPHVAEQLVANLLQVKVKTPEGIKKVKGEFVEALQLQVVCQALWQSLGPDDTLITLDDLEAYGDVDKALGLFYENALKNTLEKTDIKQGKLRQWFERALITPTGTRGTVFRGSTETGGIPNQVVDELENQRIIRMELRGGAQWYELTHDRFVETVQTCNKNWLLLRPASDQVRQRLEERAADWDHDDRNEKRLLDDAELRLAQKWMEGSDAAEIEPSRELREFVLASEHLSKVNIERQRRIEQQARVAKLSSLISVLAAVGLLAALFGFWQWSKNKDAAEVTERLKREAKETELRYQLQYVEKNALAEASANLKKAYGSLRSGNLDEAESQFNEQLKANIKSDNKAAIGNTYCTLGDIWAKRGNARMAISKYDEALKIFTSDQQFSNDEAQAYLKKAAAHFDLGKQIEAGRNSADALTQYNSSFGFSNKAKVIFTKNKNDAGARDARNAYDVAKRFYDDLKAKLEAPADLGAEP